MTGSLVNQVPTRSPVLGYVGIENTMTLSQLYPQTSLGTGLTGKGIHRPFYVGDVPQDTSVPS